VRTDGRSFVAIDPDGTIIGAYGSLAAAMRAFPRRRA
jgi:hypothetical protein